MRPPPRGQHFAPGLPPIIFGISVSFSVFLVALPLILTPGSDPLAATPVSTDDFPLNQIHLEYELSPNSTAANLTFLANTISVRLFTSEPVSDFPFDILVTNCTASQSPSFCSLDRSYRTVLSAYPHAVWFIFAPDSMTLNIPNLRRYIRVLNSIADPQRHLVLRKPRIPETAPDFFTTNMFIVSRALIDFQLENGLTFLQMAASAKLTHLDMAQSMLWDEILMGTDDQLEPYILNSNEVECFSEECPAISSLYKMGDVLGQLRGECVLDGIVYFYRRSDGAIRTCTSKVPVLYARYSVKKLRARLPLITAGMVDQRVVERIQNGTCETCFQRP
jgi:hypothetical protein